MCGLVSIINNKSPLLPHDFLNTIEHRGRNANHHITFENHFFGHTLLNTTDVNIGNSLQPVKSENTGNIILFNGEIFNFKEIKKTIFENKTSKQILTLKSF